MFLDTSWKTYNKMHGHSKNVQHFGKCANRYVQPRTNVHHLEMVNGFRGHSFSHKKMP